MCIKVNMSLLFLPDSKEVSMFLIAIKIIFES